MRPCGESAIASLIAELPVPLVSTFAHGFEQTNDAKREQTQFAPRPVRGKKLLRMSSVPLQAFEPIPRPPFSARGEIDLLAIILVVESLDLLRRPICKLRLFYGSLCSAATQGIAFCPGFHVAG